MTKVISDSEEKIAVVGAGSIGVAWSVVFATAGCDVTLYDTDGERLQGAVREFAAIVEELHQRRLVSVDAAQASQRLRIEPDLRVAVMRATYVQECAPEKIAVKQALFSELSGYTGPDTILASSSSAIPISSVVGELPVRERAILVHPLNPPYLLRVVEIVPAAFTAGTTTERAQRLMSRVGMEPLTINAEIEGFLFNRLQGALLREAYCLVRDGIASVEQVDRAVSHGLGVRWSVLGVFETVDLNTRGGIESHAEKMGPAYARMGTERGQNDPWTKDLVAKVAGARRALLPLDKWQACVDWRNERLMDLAQVRAQDQWGRKPV